MKTKTTIPNHCIKKFLELYSSGRGISNKQLKKLAPNVYTGDRHCKKENDHATK